MEISHMFIARVAITETISSSCENVQNVEYRFTGTVIREQHPLPQLLVGDGRSPVNDSTGCFRKDN